MSVPNIFRDGGRKWFKNSQRHRDDSPASEWSNGTLVWYKDGKIHRSNGPAIEDADGSRVWYTDDVFTKYEHP
jgi:hypothetical protein